MFSAIKIVTILIVVNFSFVQSVLSAPGKLANAPLFTSTNVAPNVFFEVDDSGSMDWEILTAQHWEACAYKNGDNTCGSLIDNGLYRDKTNDNGYEDFEYLFNNDDDAYSNSCNGSRQTLEMCSATVQNSDWRVKSSATNVLYYNPNITYLPWQTGDGSAMDVASFITARSNPQSGTSGYSEQRNLSGLVYSVWTDSHGFSGVRPTSRTINKTLGANNLVDWWDEHLRYTVNRDSITVEQISYTGITETISNTTTLIGTLAQALLNGRTISEEQQNIANWYQYSRRRSFVAKSAIAKVITDNPDYRYGLNFINNSSFPYASANSNFVEAPATKASIAGNMALIKGLNSLNWPAQGTPLRQGLERAGKYFDNTDNRVDPIIQQCQQNFSVLFTDGYWKGDAPATTIGNADGDGYSITVADVAKYYYDKDLSPFANNVASTVFDPAEHQHMSTYTVAFGVRGKLTDTDNDGQPNNTSGGNLTESDNWGDAFSADSPEKIDDLWHAAYNSRGTFVSAETPQDVSQALGAALSNIGDRIGTAGSVTFNTTKLSQGSAVYLSQFNSSNNKWSGDLLSFPLDASGNVSATVNWSAAEVLEATSSPETTRNIFTYNGKKGSEFSWLTLSETQKQDLRIEPNNSISDDTKAEARLDFIRGDRSNEEDNSGTFSFRKRSKLLGDIVHSSPVFVGPSTMILPDIHPFPTAVNETHSTFKLATKTRQPVVYIGANDGMLHGFKASDGSEVMAYISNSLFSANSATQGLHYLTDSDYTHRYYTDMPSTISDVYINSNDGNGDSWHTILIGGGRAGSRGLFALDVTNPNNFVQNEANAEHLVLWEFNQHNDADMGFTYSQPTIAMMNNGRWAAVFGNGYNSTGDGKAKLFILFLDGGIDGVWTDGSAGSDLDYIKIDTGVGSNISANCQNSVSNCNGLSTPQLIDLNNDKVADRVYAGDLAGNMWAFDLTTANEANWDVATKISDGTAKPLFTATYSSQPQAITDKPIVVRHPDSDGADPDILVFFGTGQYLASSDISNTDIQSFYGVWDNGSHSLTPDNLVEQSFITADFFNDGKDVSDQIRVLSENNVDYMAGDHGWKINLSLVAGERVIVDAAVRGDLVFFNTWIPDANPCDAGGTGVLMSVNQLNGGSPSAAAFNLDGQRLVNQGDRVTWTDANGIVHSSVPVGQKFDYGLPSAPVFLGDKQYTGGTDNNNIVDRDVAPLLGSDSVRTSWHELDR